MKKELIDFDKYWESLKKFKTEKTEFLDEYQARFNVSDRSKFNRDRRKGKLTVNTKLFAGEYFGIDFFFSSPQETTNT